MAKNKCYARSITWTRGLALLLAASLSLPLQGAAAQNDPEGTVDIGSTETIRVSSDLVTVPISVSDRNGNAVADLAASDFRIEEDGRPQEIHRVADAGQSPLELALLFDISGSVHHRFEFEQKAATGFLQKVWKPGDAISIITFNEQPLVRTNGARSLKEALQQLQSLSPTSSATAFYDSVVFSARLLRDSAQPETRRASVVLSDGEDNRSDNTIADALREVQRADTVFYSINPGGNSIRLNKISIKGQQNLRSLAAETGGDAFVSDNHDDLDRIFGRIASELRTQYLLTYYSSNSVSDRGFRKIRVSIPSRPDLRIRARQGYYAGSSQRWTPGR